jgi:hypothetical protein
MMVSLQFRKGMISEVGSLMILTDRKKDSVLRTGVHKRNALCTGDFLIFIRRVI